VSDMEGLYRNAVAFLHTRINYLQGSSRGNQGNTATNRTGGSVTAGGVFAPGTRYEFEVLGVGREEKPPPAPPSDPRVWRLPFEDFLTGASTYRVPVSFRIAMANTSGLTLSLGTWSQEPDDDDDCIRRAEVLRSLLGVLYPVVTTTPPHPFRSTDGLLNGAGGLITGHPTAKAPVVGDNVLPVDRLIRALGSRPWSVNILAAPESETLPQRLREALVAELNFAHEAQRATGHDLPVVKQFTALVEPALEALLDATMMGAWRTAVYLQADPATYPMLSSIWRSVFSGERSAPEAIHVLDLGADLAQQLSGTWAFPLDADQPAPAEYRHPFGFQTLLNSTQLAAYIHLPSLEVPGYWVDLIPRFDVSVAGHGESGTRLGLGAVVARPSGSHDPYAGTAGSAGGPPFSVSVPTLSRHVFIAGVTGSGKTTTSLHLLRGLHAQGVPFLVIEPAKREYRELAMARMHDPASERLAHELRVFSVSSNEGLPFRINPFEVEEGTSVSEHIDLLRSVFAASFGDMWTPLPQVLEQCMRRVYRDRGWDLASGQNHRLLDGEDRALAFPTLRELAGTVDDIVDRLGFDPEARDRVRGSLATRINGLRVGSKGVLFDTRSSLSMVSLLGQPTILELERLADESDKAFLIGLLLIRLVEFRRGERRSGPTGARAGDGLRHILVIEEAHRLLASITNDSGGDNTAKAMAIESFSNLLAEIRAYGQGIVVLDQVPTKLASDVIKNTNLKLAHRIVDEADRKVLAGSMAMSEGQMAGLAILARGEAAVFGDGDDAPLLVRISPPLPPQPTQALASSEGKDMTPTDQPLLHWGCACTGENYAAVECAMASELVEQDEIQQGIARIAAAALQATSVDELSSSELIEAMRRDVARGGREALVIGCLAGRGAEWLADAWGARGSWSFGRTHEFAQALRLLLIDALDAHAEDGIGSASTDALATYQRIGLELHRRTTDPYPSCSAICTGDLADYCLYRHATASTLQRPDVLSAWADARTRDADAVDGYPITWNTSVTTIAAEVLGPHVQPEPRRAVALCFAQQAVAAESPAWPPWSRKQFVGDLIALADQTPAREQDAVDSGPLEPLADPSEQVAP
jgi:Helicase HerA, central domain